MCDFLSTMAAASRRRLREAKAQIGEAELLRRANARPDPQKLRGDAAGFDVFAEIKPRSPSRGSLLAEGSRGAAGYGAAYARGGAIAVSVVTEPTAFSGSLETLATVAMGCNIPVMRKDFLVEPYQVMEARAHGASGVLLIARLLDGALLGEMIAATCSMKLFFLVEAFDLDDLERAAGALLAAQGVGLLGVNSRDLGTLSLDKTRHAALARSAPAGPLLVAESGIATPEDAAEVARLGYGAALVGESLMRAADPVPLLRKMIASGREAWAQREVTR
jgi:indole-3-glycerol phosphate synthase